MEFLGRVFLAAAAGQRAEHEDGRHHESPVVELISNEWDS
jgi:hypothetical protein